MASETQPSDPSRTVLFNKYEMGRLLGKGTFAKVYFAKNIQTSESVAIKVIHKDHVLKNHFMMDQIKREISVMRLLRHPNVVHLREVLATRSKIFFVMDLVRGGELFSRVARSKLREDLARRYFQQLISAVHFCHARGVSHRDLKPENLLLDDNGDLKVSDFGLSALPEQLRYDGLLHTQCGTPAYVAPEVLRKRGYDGSKADIWSCGVVLFVLLAGFLPFQDENLMRMYRKVFKADFHFPPWISPDARRLISRLLVVDPAKRISIPEIMAVPWFKKGYVNPLDGSAAGIEEMMVEEEEEVKSPSKPAFFNAFELISSMSSGFDLSGLFETEVEGAEVFTSRAAAGEIVERLMGLREGGVRRVWRVREFKVRVEGERLAVTAEVFEAAPEMAVVEISRSYGDAVDYRRFCEEVVRPALKDIVWSWRGGTNGERDGNGNGGSGSSLGVF